MHFLGVKELRRALKNRMRRAQTSTGADSGHHSDLTYNLDGFSISSSKLSSGGCANHAANHVSLSNLFKSMSSLAVVVGGLTMNLRPRPSKLAAAGGTEWSRVRSWNDRLDTFPKYSWIGVLPRCSIAIWKAEAVKLDV